MLSPRLIHSPCSKPSLFNPIPPARKQTCLGCLNGLLAENRRRGPSEGSTLMGLRGSQEVQHWHRQRDLLARAAAFKDLKNPKIKGANAEPSVKRHLITTPLCGEKSFPGSLSEKLPKKLLGTIHRMHTLGLLV